MLTTYLIKIPRPGCRRRPIAVPCEPASSGSRSKLAGPEMAPVTAAEKRELLGPEEDSFQSVHNGEPIL